MIVYLGWENYICIICITIFLFRKQKVDDPIELGDSARFSEDGEIIFNDN